VDTWITPLFEVEEGILRVSRKTEAKPVIEYLKPQGRFRHLTEAQISYIQEQVDDKREDLLTNNGRKIIL
jgi:pyruvate ferredoxin oxidoreductase beta subunit